MFFRRQVVIVAWRRLVAKEEKRARQHSPSRELINASTFRNGKPSVSCDTGSAVRAI